jgi:hypothetical protein
MEDEGAFLRFYESFGKSKIDCSNLKYALKGYPPTSG